MDSLPISQVYNPLSFHITTIYAGTETHMFYKNHYESVYCLSGTGEIENKETGLVHAISPGTIYVLDRHDRHVLSAQTELTSPAYSTAGDRAGNPRRDRRISSRDLSLRPDA